MSECLNKIQCWPVLRQTWPRLTSSESSSVNLPSSESERISNISLIWLMLSNTKSKIATLTVLRGLGSSFGQGKRFIASIVMRAAWFSFLSSLPRFAKSGKWPADEARLEEQKHSFNISYVTEWGINTKASQILLDTYGEKRESGSIRESPQFCGPWRVLMTTVRCILCRRSIILIEWVYLW